MGLHEISKTENLRVLRFLYIQEAVGEMLLSVCYTVSVETDLRKGFGYDENITS